MYQMPRANSPSGAKVSVVKERLCNAVSCFVSQNIHFHL